MLDSKREIHKIEPFQIEGTDYFVPMTALGPCSDLLPFKPTTAPAVCKDIDTYLESNHIEIYEDNNDIFLYVYSPDLDKFVVLYTAWVNEIPILDVFDIVSIKEVPSTASSLSAKRMKALMEFIGADGIIPNSYFLQRVALELKSAFTVSELVDDETLKDMEAQRMFVRLPLIPKSRKSKPSLSYGGLDLDSVSLSTSLLSRNVLRIFEKDTSVHIHELDIVEEVMSIAAKGKLSLNSSRIYVYPQRSITTYPVLNEEFLKSALS